MKGFLAKSYKIRSLQNYLSDIDALFMHNDSLVIKDFGNTKTAVVSLDLGKGEEKFVLKKYKPKSLLHPLFIVFRESKALKVWLISKALFVRDIPIPKPVAMAEKRKMGLRINGYIITQFIEDAVNFKAYVNSRGTGFMKDGRLMKKLGQAIGQMHASYVIHGDLKWSNILLKDIGGNPSPVFVDLDHARQSNKYSDRDRAKDLARFVADIREMGLAPQLAETFIESYFDAAVIKSNGKGDFVKRMDRVTNKIMRRHQKFSQV
jgi:tRNA A-37 threonylcarbamoyl transferase component Bud32